MKSEIENLNDVVPARSAQSALLACVLVSPYGVAEPDRLDLAEALHAQCARVTDRVAWRHPRGQSWPDAALLDLGPCAVSEAQIVCAPLMAWGATRQLVARIGIGATQTIAQLAARVAAPGVIRAVAPEEAHGFLQRLAVEALSGLAVEGVTPELVARLRRYGLRTLGQVAQLHTRDPQALRRQFGAAAGGRLAALAQGEDLYPLHATPTPARAAVRLRFSSGATADQALIALPRLAARLARRLEASERCGQTLRLAVTWESGAITHARRRLARPLHQPGELTQAAHALLSAILTPAEPASSRSASVAALALSLGDLSARLPAQQGALLEMPQATPTVAAESRLERIALEVGEPLARRYGAPALYRLTTPQPDAILPEERARLVSLISGQSAPPTNRVASRTPRQRHNARALDEAPSDPANDPVNNPTQAPQPHWW